MGSIYFIGCIVAFFLTLAVRCPKFRVVTLADLIAAFVCGLLSWLSIGVIVGIFLSVIGLSLFQDAKNIIIFKRGKTNYDDLYEGRC
jgi:hypothetical protein